MTRVSQGLGILEENSGKKSSKKKNSNRLNKKSQAWKDFERAIAEAAKEVGFTNAFRVLRGDDIGISDVDIIIPELPHIKIDAKYRANFSHHSLFKSVEKKYCKKEGDFLVLPTKTSREHHSLSVVRTEVLMRLLANTYLGDKKRLDLLNCPKCTGYIDNIEPISNGLKQAKCSQCNFEFIAKEM